MKLCNLFDVGKALYPAAAKALCSQIVWRNLIKIRQNHGKALEIPFGLSLEIPGKSCKVSFKPPDIIKSSQQKVPWWTCSRKVEAPLAFSAVVVAVAVRSVNLIQQNWWVASTVSHLWARFCVVGQLLLFKLSLDHLGSVGQAHVLTCSAPLPCCGQREW